MPCMRCCRARCVFSPKLGIIIQDFARQLFDQLLADQAILMAGGAVLTLPAPIPVQRSHGFTRPTTRRGAECAPPTVKPLYLQTYFRLAASGSRGKAAADIQSLRLHRPQAPVSPTAVSAPPNDPPACPTWGGVELVPVLQSTRSSQCFTLELTAEVASSRRTRRRSALSHASGVRSVAGGSRHPAGLSFLRLSSR